jgi:glyoxylase I family protein
VALIINNFKFMKIHHIAITVNNLEESRQFYQDFFKFNTHKIFERKDLGAKAIFLELSGFYLELWQFKDLKDNSDDLRDIKVRGIRHIAFEVENLDKIISDVQQKGVEATKAKLSASGHYYSFISDPNGVALELYQK